MAEKYFNISYEFNRDAVMHAIDRRVASRRPGFICVADGVILDIANRDPEYLEAINASMFAICDSSYVPLYIRLIHGRKYSQYCGSEIFHDVVSARRHRMFFLGAQQHVLDALRQNLTSWNPDVLSMTFTELPYCEVDEFDYPNIARAIDEDGAEIIWVALGAPKQELFMHRLLPHLNHGVMIAVGAAFKFYSGLDEKRAPDWMVRNHLEFLHRIVMEPRKQIRRCSNILRSLPRILYEEVKKKK